MKFNPSKQISALAISSLILCIWALALPQNQALIPIVICLFGILGVISTFFNSKLGGIFLLIFYIPQVLFLQGNSWLYKFSPGIDFAFSIGLGGDRKNPDFMLSVNILALIFILFIIKICFNDQKNHKGQAES